MKLSAAPLEGRFVRLEPLDEALREPMRAAIAGEDPIWDIMSSSAQGERFNAWFDLALSEMTAGERIAYAARRLGDGRVIGTTSFLHIDAANRNVEIGATFLHADARAGAANPDMKRTLMAHAFAQGALRVELRTDARNLRSQAAIAKLGAAREGVLRRHKTTWTGHVRDTVMYAVTDLDWPAVRDGLDRRLAKFDA